MPSLFFVGLPPTRNSLHPSLKFPLTKQNVGSIIEETNVLILCPETLLQSSIDLIMSSLHKPSPKSELRAMQASVPSLGGHVLRPHDGSDHPPAVEGVSNGPETVTGLHVRKHMKAGFEVVGQGLKALWGAVDVQVERENGRLRIDFVDRIKAPVQLLPLLESLTDIPPMTAVLGWSGENQPVLLDLQTESAAHILIAGNKGAGKTTLLRSIALSLAISNKESRLQMVFLTPGSSHPTFSFAPFGQLPHLLTPITDDKSIVLETLQFLIEEIQHRQRERISTPAIAVIADDVERLIAWHPTLVNQVLSYIIGRGAKHGVHLIASTADITHRYLQDMLDADVPARLVGQVNSADEAELATDALDSYAENLLGAGDFLAAVGDMMIRFQAAAVADKDLMFCVDYLQRRRPPSLLAQEFHNQHIRQPAEQQQLAWYVPSQQAKPFPPQAKRQPTPQPTPPTTYPSPPLPITPPELEPSDWNRIGVGLTKDKGAESVSEESLLAMGEPEEPKPVKSASSMKHLASIFATLYPHTTAEATDLAVPEDDTAPSFSSSQPAISEPSTYFAEAEPTYEVRDVAPPKTKATKAQPATTEPDDFWFDEDVEAEQQLIAEQALDWVAPPPPAAVPTSNFFNKLSPDEVEIFTKPRRPQPEKRRSPPPQPTVINQAPPPTPKAKSFSAPPPSPPPSTEDPWLSGLLPVDDEVESLPATAPSEIALSASPSIRPTPTPQPAPYTNPKELIRVATKLGNSKPVPKPTLTKPNLGSEEMASFIDPQAMIESQELPEADVDEIAQASPFVQKPRRVHRLQRKAGSQKQIETGRTPSEMATDVKAETEEAAE